MILSFLRVPQENADRLKLGGRTTCSYNPKTFRRPRIFEGDDMPQLKVLLLYAAALCGPVFFTQPSFAQQLDDRIVVAEADWPWWRGPLRNGIARGDQRPPVRWSESENVAWQSPVPGRGHGSPTVAGGRVYLATVDEQAGSQSVLCYDRRSGKLLWRTEVHHSGAMMKNEKSSAASCRVACRRGRAPWCRRPRRWES